MQLGIDPDAATHDALSQDGCGVVEMLKIEPAGQLGPTLGVRDFGSQELSKDGYCDPLTIVAIRLLLYLSDHDMGFAPLRGTRSPVWNDQ